MNKKNILGILILLILISLLTVLTVLLFNPSNAPKNTDSNIPTVNPGENDVTLSTTPDAGQEYIDKIYFVGESTTAHFFKGGIDRSHILVPSSATLTLGSDILQITVGDKKLTIPDAVADANAEILILTIGINNASRFGESQYKAFYGKLIKAIKEYSPSTKIIIQSSFPVTAEYSASGTVITNEAIDQNNKWAKEIAKQYGLRYLDTQSILKNSNGALIDEYCNGDGVHLTEEAYIEIIRYIRTHAID
jgi:lysophospholipase L1-like esterase